MYLATFTANGTVFVYVTPVASSVTFTVTLPLVELTVTVLLSMVTVCEVTEVIFTTPTLFTLASQFTVSCSPILYVTLSTTLPSLTHISAAQALEVSFTSPLSSVSSTIVSGLQIISSAPLPSAPCLPLE